MLGTQNKLASSPMENREDYNFEDTSERGSMLKAEF
jgi:hypothetical protein